MDVRQAPLMRFVMAPIEEGSGRYVVLQLLHHLIMRPQHAGVIVCGSGGASGRAGGASAGAGAVSQSRGAGVLAYPRAEHEAFFRGKLAEVTEPTRRLGCWMCIRGWQRIEESHQAAAARSDERLRRRRGGWG